MLTEKEIQQALHARRVGPLSMTNPHGPLGLEHLAAAVDRIAVSPDTLPEKAPISVKTWEKLD